MSYSASLARELAPAWRSLSQRALFLHARARMASYTCRDTPCTLPSSVCSRAHSWDQAGSVRSYSVFLCHRSCSTLLAQKTAPSFLPSECRALTLLHAADSRHSPRLNVTAILTINRRVRHSRTIEARFEIEQRWFDPRVAADVRDQRGIEAHVA